MLRQEYNIKQTFQKFHICTKHKEQEMSCEMLTHKNNICTISKKTFAKKSNLTRHQVIHQRVQVDNRYKFNYCAKSFKEKANLTRHIRIKHQKQQPINCDICNKIFFSRNRESHENQAQRKMDRFHPDSKGGTIDRSL